MEQEKSIVSNGMVVLDSEVKEVVNNPFLQDLATIMDNDVFSSFFDKHFSNIEDTKASLVYMKLYKEIQNKYQETHKGKIDKLTCLCFIKYIMDSPELRPMVINAAANKFNDPESITKVISNSNLKHLLTDNI